LCSHLEGGVVDGGFDVAGEVEASGTALGGFEVEAPDVTFGDVEGVVFDPVSGPVFDPVSGPVFDPVSGPVFDPVSVSGFDPVPVSVFEFAFDPPTTGTNLIILLPLDSTPSLIFELKRSPSFLCQRIHEMMTPNRSHHIRVFNLKKRVSIDFI
jgi:hypothetical protein